MPLERVRLGETGLYVSEIMLGTSRFGRGPDEGGSTREASHDLIDQYLAAGGNVLDTAHVYNSGNSERVIGEWIEANDREDLVIVSKVGYRDRDPENPKYGGLHRRNVRRQVQESLDRLNTDYLDVLFVHRWDDETLPREYMQTLNTFVEEGMVNYLGASHHTPNAWQVVRANAVAGQHGYEPFTVTQMGYSLINRGLERNYLDMCRAEDLGVTTYRSLAGGFLTGKYHRGEDPPADSRGGRSESFREQYFTAANFDVLDVVRSVAEEVDATPGQVALAWLLHHEGVTAPIVGAYSSEVLAENLAAAEIELTDDQFERLQSARPGSD